MPGGTPEAYKHIEPIVQAVAAQVSQLMVPCWSSCCEDITNNNTDRGSLAVVRRRSVAAAHSSAWPFNVGSRYFRPHIFPRCGGAQLADRSCMLNVGCGGADSVVMAYSWSSSAMMCWAFKFAVVMLQVDDGPCVTYVGPGGAGNFVKMVHNGIEYGDMQLISEAYDVLRTVGGLTNEEMVEAFNEWNAVRHRQPALPAPSLSLVSLHAAHLEVVVGRSTCVAAMGRAVKCEPTTHG